MHAPRSGSLLLGVAVRNGRAAAEKEGGNCGEKREAMLLLVHWPQDETKGNGAITASQRTAAGRDEDPLASASGVACGSAWKRFKVQSSRHTRMNVLLR